MPNLSEEDRLKIIEWAKKHSVIERVWFYGSRARGTNEPDSDIDLAVVMKQNSEEDAFTVWFFWDEEFKKKPDLKLSRPVQIEWYEKGVKLERVGSGVERDGVLLYERIL
ncbi:MAG TPA: nucleotidyltransferase domain-containing protein [Alphaproteobacteria bacterium]